MKTGILAALLLWQSVAAREAPLARPDAMRYERALHVEGTRGQACAVLDGQVFSHAAASLADMRIFSVGEAKEIPYAVTESEAVTEETQAARVLNLANGGGKIAFDLEMPQRAYTDVRLELDPAVENFIAAAEVTGWNELRGGVGTALGSFTLFDLTGQRLGRDTTLALAESSFRYLHVVMRVVNAPGAEKSLAARFGPGMVVGAEVPPSREGQILYTTVADTSSIAAVGRESRAAFELPVRVPVERISFVVAPGFKGNFSRGVRVTALAENAGADARAVLPETMSGRIWRVRATEVGTEVKSEGLGVPAILGANLQGAAKVEVAVENGDEQALTIVAVRLEMRQREVCFDAAAAAAGGVGLFYGEPGLEGPAYDFERKFVVGDKTVVAELGPERLNAAYRAPVRVPGSFAERHPWELWVGLIAVLFALGAVVLRWPRNGCG